MIKFALNMTKNYFCLKKRKGLDKPVFIVAAITLAILFVSVYFASVSGWMDGALTEFGERSSSIGPDP